MLYGKCIKAVCVRYGNVFIYKLFITILQQQWMRSVWAVYLPKWYAES